MANPLQQAGSQSDKPAHFAPLYLGRMFTGIWLQRSPLRDPSTRVESLYYGGRQDALIAGVNVELTNLLTLARRPGTSAYSLQSATESINSFYSFKTFTTLTETIQVMMDGLTQIYTISPSTITSIYTKSHGAGSASFLGINNTLYIGDGIDQRAWSGSGATRNWGIAQAGLSLTSAYTGSGTAGSASGTAATQGPVSPSVGINGSPSVINTSLWSPSDGGTLGSDVQVLDGIVANSVLTAVATGGGGILQNGTVYLVATGCGLSVPTGATINGVAVNIYKGNAATISPDFTTFSPNIVDDSVYLTIGGVPQDSAPNHQSFDMWPVGYIAPTTYGSSTDTWGGVTLTPAIVNDPGFGITFACETVAHTTAPSGFVQGYPEVDQITITVYYTTASLPTWANPANIVGAPDAVYSTCTPDSDLLSASLFATNFGMNLSGTVEGVVVNVTGHVSAAAPDNTLYAQLLDNNGNLMGIQKSVPFSSTGDITISFGSNSDLWASPITTMTVNSATATITNTALTSNVATYTADNTFAIGQLVTVTGTSAGGGVFNVVSQPVVSSDGATFTIAITHGNVISGSDSGTAFAGFGVQVNVSGNGPIFSIDSVQFQIYTAAITVDHTGMGSFSATTGYGYVYEYSNGNVTPPVFSNASPAANTGAFTNAAFATIGVVASPDPQVNSIWIFRTTDGGTDYESLPTNPYPNVTATIDDDTADADLNSFQLAAVLQQNSPPPPGVTGTTFHMGRLWAFVNNVLYYATGPDLGNVLGNPYESWSLANFFTLPSAITKLVSTTVGLIVFTISDIYIVYGTGSAVAAATGVAGITVFYVAPFIQGIGLLSRFAADVNGTTIYMNTSDGQVLSLDPSSGVSEIGFPIGSPNIAYPSDPSLQSFNPANSYVSWHVSGSQDKALYVADGSTGWFRCNTSQAPDGGFVWSPKANITGGCQAVQSIETSPGIHQLLIGPTNQPQLTTPFLVPSLHVSPGGPSLAPGSYFFVVTGVDGSGNQTTVSDQAGITIGSNEIITLFYGGDPRSTSFRIWFGINTPGGQTQYFTTTNPSSFIFTTTSGASTGVLPTSNTTVISGGPILYRNVNTFNDNGITYPANFTMGSIVLAYPGEMAELAFITCDFNKVGTSPQVSILMNEISGAFSSLSGYVHSDPPQIYGTTEVPSTLYANRYDFQQSVNGGVPPPIYCRHLQIYYDFGSTDGVRNELLSSTIYGAHWNEA